MPNTSSYICWFSCSDETDGHEVSANNHADAAEEFAAYAQSECDMWEHRNEWDGDYAVVVKHCYTGKVMRFNILREFEPVFAATEVK